MRRLTLLRHAKSDWSDGSLRDFDRPLNRRGERSIGLIGKRLKANGVRPSLILSSDAVRALTTARGIAREIGYPVEFIQPEPELYLAAPATIIDVVARQGESYNDVMVVGHNPGMTDLANQLSDARVDNMPTCGVFAVEVDIKHWGGLVRKQGKFQYFDYPKKPD